MIDDNKALGLRFFKALDTGNLRLLENLFGVGGTYEETSRCRSSAASCGSFLLRSTHNNPLRST